MLPVGIRNASMTNALKTKASMKAVISHSKVLAISATLFFRAAVLEPVFSVLLGDINADYAVKWALHPLFQKKTDPNITSNYIE
jgi:hypothetical protein